MTGQGLPGEGLPLDEGALPEARHSPEALDRVRRRLRVGAFLGAGAVGVLAVATPLPFWDVVALPAFYLLLPALALAQTPLLESERLERIPVYLGSAAAILILGWASLGLGLRLDGARGLGLVALPGGEMLAWTVGITAAGILVVALFHPVDRRVPGPHHRILRDLLPRTPAERLAFLGLSAAAGTGEELAYRGYALAGIQLLGPGPWAAVILSSAAFGFLHAYQGPVGIVRTGVMGAILAVPVIFTGSLLPSMAAHMLIDVIAGIFLGPFLTREEPLVPPRDGG